MRRIIKITESDLMRIVEDAAVHVINEGQGWDDFKAAYRRWRNQTSDEAEKVYQKQRLHRGVKHDDQDYVDYGTRGGVMHGMYERPYYYSPSPDEESKVKYLSSKADEKELEKQGYRPVDLTPYGKEGRRASVKAQQMLYKLSHLKHRLKNFRNPKRATWY